MSKTVPESLNPFLQEVPHGVDGQYDALIKSAQLLMDAIKTSSPHTNEKKD